jgi:hypothetical protein
MSQDITGGRGSGSAISGRRNGSRQNGGRGSSTITQELVNRIADKVYAMLLSDLKIEEERGRSSLRKPFAEQGGW